MWKSRAQVADSCLKVRRVDCVTNAPVPQGTTASSTPPFVMAGYGCRNNTTVLSRPETAGWAPLVCAGPLTTSLRGLWVSGLLPPGNGGTNEGAATQKPTERHKGAATQKPTSVRRNSRSNLGARGGDPRTLASWRYLFSASCRGNCLSYGVLPFQSAGRDHSGDTSSFTWLPRSTSATGFIAVSVFPRVVRPHCSSVQALVGPSRWLHPGGRR